MTGTPGATTGGSRVPTCLFPDPDTPSPPGSRCPPPPARPVTSPWPSAESAASSPRSTSWRRARPRLVVDISCNARDEAHAAEITAALEALPGVRVRKVSDRTFLLHLGGKIEVHSKVSLRNRDDLSRAYTPGVARVCQAIAANPADARRLTIKRNTVAVVTDGSAVLGLGNLGAAAAMPVMEGKAALFKRFAGRRRLAGVPGHPGHRGDHPDRPDPRPGLRRHQPGGHRRAALLRDRGAAARDARHPRLPRRPARHRGRRARARCATRCAWSARS